MAASSELQKAVNALVKAEPGWKEFLPAPNKGAKAPSVGKGVAKGGGSGGGGFDESDYTLRQYWPVDSVSTITTTDGLFSIEVEPIKSIELAGGGRATFKQPVEP